jgi:hypothetical protein
MKLKLSSIVFWGIIVVGMIAGGFYLGGLSKQTTIDEYNQRLEAVQDSARAVLENNTALKKQQDSILALNIVKDSVIQAREQRIKDLRAKEARQSAALTGLAARNDSLLQSLDSTMTDSTRLLVNGLREERDSALDLAETRLKRADEADSLALDWKGKATNFEASLRLANKRADDAESSLNDCIKIPKAPDPDKLFGLIKMPSRTVTFFVGAAAGVLVTAAVK